jgi:hypothetical protein
MISLCCPSRGRPDNVRRLISSARDTAANKKEIEFVFYFDDDDEISKPLLADSSIFDGQLAVGIVGARTVLSECSNVCAAKARGEILQYCGDDIVFRTQNWDRLVTRAFAAVPDRILLVYGRDGIQDENLATHGFLHRRWVDTLGYLCPPYFSSDWSDTWLSEVAMSIGRLAYVPELYTEHMHFWNGKAPLDQTHLERLERGARDKVQALYAEKALERQRDAAKLLEVMSW